MTAPAPAPGQAAYEAMFASMRARNPNYRHIPWTDLDRTRAGLNREDYEAAAQAAIDVFLAGDSVSAESIREALAAQEQPAPASASQVRRHEAQTAVGDGPVCPDCGQRGGAYCAPETTEELTDDTTERLLETP